MLHMTPLEQAQAAFAGHQHSATDIRLPLSHLRARFERLAAAWVARREVARGLRQLHRCTDRELWDMGLSRSDFPAIIKGTYRRD
jgi:uncharacterized protein YjiS (DUF1127 family)